MVNNRKLFIFLGILIFVQCQTSYYYVEGGVRVKEKKPPILKNIINDYSKIDLNSIYYKDNWFYKFYPNNKVGFSKRDKKISISENLNPVKGKMGYFRIEGNQLTTYILINKGNKKFNVKKYTLRKEGLIHENESYLKFKLNDSIKKWVPDW